MANVQHSALTDPNLHEPKGIASANANELYVADGSTSGAWQKLSPPSLSGITSNGSAGQFLSVDGSGNFVFAYSAHGGIYFFDAVTPTVITYPSTYAKVNAVTTPLGSPVFITEGTNSRLTYTGTDTIDLDVVFNLSIDQSTGTNKDIQAAIYKNGTLVNGTQVIATCRSGEKLIVSSHGDVNMATNDYVEVYVKNNGGSGNVNVYSFSLMASTAGA
jgi:hypothetical protein